MIVLEFAAGVLGGFLMLVYLGTAYERAARLTSAAVAYVGRAVESVGSSIHAMGIAHLRWQQAVRATDGAMLSPLGLTPCCRIPADRLELVQEDPHALGRFRRVLHRTGASVGWSRWVARCTCDRLYLVEAEPFLRIRRA